MKKLTSIILAILTVLSLFAITACGKDAESEKTMADLLVGDWYTYSGAPYRSFTEDGTVTGTNDYSSSYTVEDNMITWDTAAGDTVTVEYWTDGETLRISTDTGAYFTTRRYYYRSAEGTELGTGMPQRGTTDKAIFGSWYSGSNLFFTLNEDGSVVGYRDVTGFSFLGDELVLFTAGVSLDEVASCKLEGDTLTIYYTSETTGEQAELVLTREAATNAALEGLTDEQLFLPDDEGPDSEDAE